MRNTTQLIIDRCRLQCTCICCKTLEHIIVSNINKHLALENILADCQHGFRSQRSCETQLVQFYHDLVSNLDRAVSCGHRQTDVIVMDFAKAFDKVPHKRLLYKLDFYGIRGSTHKWIDSWLSERLVYTFSSSRDCSLCAYFKLELPEGVKDGRYKNNHENDTCIKDWYYQIIGF